MKKNKEPKWPDTPYRKNSAQVAVYELLFGYCMCVAAAQEFSPPKHPSSTAKNYH
jgi:hypothetical protein